MTGLAKNFETLGRMTFPRLAGLVATLALAACASGNPSSPSGKTVATQPPAAQVPAGSGGQDAVKVGLLLPLSGPGANVGSEMLNAAQIALFDLGGDRFNLLPRDTKGSPAEAAEATRKLVADGAKLILGPLFATEVDAAAPVARSAAVNLLAFSNDWQRAGNGTYILGFVPADQVARIVGYARTRGLTRIAALAPRNPYGDAVIAALHDSAQRQGVSVVREERYTADNADLAAAVARIGAAPSAAPAPAAAAGAAAGAPVATTTGGAFDALLIADGGDRLKAIAPLLAANRIDPARVRLLGTGLWDDPGIVRLPGIAGAWFAAPAPQARADFEGRFEGLYHHRPARLATLAYDATALAAVLARLPSRNSFDSVNLTNPSGFAGVDGIFRLRGDGLVERGLAVIEIGPQGPRVIDQAPTSFEAVSSAR
ncbi:MAG: penicillin-binding protein activator [Rhodospirillaceae bacterium]